MPKLDPLIADHLEWLGFVQPTGLVVSAPALVKAGAILNRQDREGHKLLSECVTKDIDAPSVLPDFQSFAASVLEWSFSPQGYTGTIQAPLPASLQAQFAEGILRPDYAVRSEFIKDANKLSSVSELRDAPTPPKQPEENSEWQLLVRVCPEREGFDKVTRARIPADGGLEASAHGRMERLLRETGVPAGLLFNGNALRLMSAPRGESSGWLDFKVEDMLQTAGRPMVSALRLLLSERRLLGVPRDKRLAALLADSRKYQSEVSERLAEQVLHSLYELLRGFQAAHNASRGELLREALADNPDDVYRGLLTLVLRLVFLLYAEERGMLPQTATFLSGYGIASLFERLREDAARYSDTTNHRFGAYAQLLILFRMVHDGVSAGDVKMPPRKGALFDPDRYKFLEGRQGPGARQTGEAIDPPLVADGTVHRVLEKLMVLEGERISYRALDIEHIGSVYQTMMGFRLETAGGQSIAIKSAKKRGAPATINLEALLDHDPSKRSKWLLERTDRRLTPKMSQLIQQADSLDSLHAALDPVIDRNATPDKVPKGSMILQPSEERRRSGSHYTPRELTEPIVRRALEPVFDRLRTQSGGAIHPNQILEMKVCDPAMGPGAFLVEACRQLGDALVEAWRAHEISPEIPSDESELIFARRMVAQRCLYGIDRNPKAVDLAKLSLWLATLAKDHPLTFLDHALAHGDFLVGLSRRQLDTFHWAGDAPKFQQSFEAEQTRKLLSEAIELRSLIQEADESLTQDDLRQLDREAKDAIWRARLLGDLVIAAFFEKAKPKEREQVRLRFAQAIQRDELAQYASWIDELRNNSPPLVPFHGEIEFPEVFGRENPGFDVIIGNPPFGGKNTVIRANRDQYPAWLKHLHAGSHGNADLVAHFFRRAFCVLRQNGTFGLIATNTIAQGDTRGTGLRWICEHGGEIYDAHRRVKWPGLAAVVVSVVHVHKGQFEGIKKLDGQESDQITAFLFHRGSDDDPARLKENADKSFVGSYVLGMGFTFDDTDKKGVATPLDEMRRLIKDNPHNQEVIYPYIGGEEVNTEPKHAHHRCVIDFRDFPLCREDLDGTWTSAENDQQRHWRQRGIVPLDYPGAVAADWPDILSIVEKKVRPERDSQDRKALRERWWQHAEKRPGLYSSVSGLERVLLISRVGQHASMTFVPGGVVYAETTIVFPFSTYSAFSALQSRAHEIWARFLASSMKDDLRYTPSDCFETFPFPENWSGHPALEIVGKQYYEYRAKIMINQNKGMTKTYNRFHDPYETSQEIVTLRELHSAMDGAVLDAYGWNDIRTDCDFVLDYEIDDAESHKKMKPYRYRWPDDVHDEVLARLVELNALRAKNEARLKKSGSGRAAVKGGA